MKVTEYCIDFRGTGMGGTRKQMSEGTIEGGTGLRGGRKGRRGTEEKEDRDEVERLGRHPHSHSLSFSLSHTHSLFPRWLWAFKL